MIDAKTFAKSQPHHATIENTINTNQNVDRETPSTPAASGGPGPGSGQPAPPNIVGSKYTSTLFGVSPSDIDKYSRVVFPVCFVVC